MTIFSKNWEQFLDFQPVNKKRVESTIHEREKYILTGVTEQAKTAIHQRKRSKLKLSVVHHSSDIKNWATNEENLYLNFVFYKMSLSHCL